MKPILGVAGAVVLAVSLAGCGGPSEAKPATPTPANVDEAFLTAWHDSFPNSDDAKAIQVGHSVCDDYKAGSTFAGEVTYLMALVPQLTGRQAGAIIGASTAAYCPEFNNRH